MNKIGLTLALLLMSYSTVDANSVKSSVSEVTVYTNGALVSRSANLELSAGEQRIELKGFPTNIDAQTLRIEVADKNVRLGQVSIKSNNFLEATDASVISLKEKIALKQNEIRQIQDSSNAAKLQLKFLESLATGYSKEAWIGSAQGSADVASWQKALLLMQSGSEDANKVIRKNILTLNARNQELSLLNRELADKRSLKASDSSVLISLISKNATTTGVKVHYLQEEAGWSPSYEARLNSLSGRLLLAQKAVLWQSTDEPWNNVDVTLSTSRPSEEMQAPVLSSEFYDLADKKRLAKVRRSREADDAYAPAAYASLEEVVVTGSRRVQQWSGNYSQNFPIAGRISVSNNDDETQSYDLETFEFDSTLVTQIVPVESTQAYLSTRFTHQGKNPIYGEQMLVYVDGVLMGTTDMPTILPGAQVTLPMGVDRRIEVNVDNLGGIGGNTGIVQKQVTDATDLNFEITNRRSTTASIEVRAVYPVSKNKALKIKIGDDATPPDDANDDGNKGVALWKKDLESGEKWVINYRYSRTRPADRDLRRIYE